MQGNRYAAESIGLACKWAYSGVREGETLSGKLVNLGTQTTTVYLSESNSQDLLTDR